jgi:hypothetical protein
MKKLVLATGYGKYDRTTPPEGLNEGRIGGYVAGMEADNHVRTVSSRPRPFINMKIGDIPHLKLQMFIPEPPGGLIAEGYHIFLKVQTGHLNIGVAPGRKVMIQRKGEIGLAASKIYYIQGLFLGKPSEGVFYKFQIFIDLTELVILLRVYPAAVIHNAELHKKGNRLPLCEQVGFLTVVCEGFPGFGGGLFGDAAKVCTGPVKLIIAAVCKDGTLCKVPQPLCKRRSVRSKRVLLMKGSGAELELSLELYAPLKGDGPQFQFTAAQLLLYKETFVLCRKGSFPQPGKHGIYEGFFYIKGNEKIR